MKFTNGNDCPICQHRKTESLTVHVDIIEARQERLCPKCTSRWVNIYAYKTYIIPTSAG